MDKAAVAKINSALPPGCTMYLRDFGRGINSMSLDLDAAGTGAHHRRTDSIGVVDMRLTTVCLASKRRPLSTCSAIFGRTPMNTVSLLSTTSWLSAATRTNEGKASCSAAAFSAFRGETTTLRGGESRVHRPRTIAVFIVPQPTTPTWRSDTPIRRTMRAAVVLSRVTPPGFGFLNFGFCG